MQAAHRLEGVLSTCLSWSNLFQATHSASLGFFQAAALVSRALSVVWVRSSEGDSQLFFLILVGRGLGNLLSFRDFLKLFGVIYLPA